MTTLSEASNLPLSGQMQVDAILHAYVPWDFTADSVIHYTFDPSAADAGTDYANVQAYDEATQDATRLALAHAADLTGIAFAETSDPQLAELHFARGDIPASGVFASDLAWEMDGSGNVTGLEADGYVFLHNIYSDVTPGEWSYELLLHEMGHALGLKHPHDSLLRLFPSEDNTDNTVMSYLGTGVFHTEFQEYDVAALDWIYGGDGLGGAGAFRDGELIQVGSAGDDILTGGTGHDYLSDGLGNDTLIGGAGNDLLVGGAGANSLDGGEGDDRYYVTAGDVLTDSAGTDWVFSTVSWILTAGLENLMLYGIGAGTGEVAMGNSLDNVIVGNERGNLIGGGAGNDTLNGGGEVDSFLFAEAPGPANADLIEDFEFGSQDELVFDAAVFTAIGQTSFTNGDARFFAGSGATSGQDSSDRVIYDTATGQVFYDADGSGGGAALLVVTLQNAPALDGAQIEVINGQGDEGMNITGTSGNDTLVGTDSNDTIDGLGGNDAISGQGGDDLMLGGGGSDQFNMTTGEASSYGNDTIDGGAGTDSLFFNYFGATGVVVDFGAGTATGGLGGTGSVVFSSIERVVATASDDHLIGAAGAQNLSGLGGSDTLEGGAGNDTLYGGGGSGIDRFTFREVGAANADSIRDFAAATDMIVLDASVMSALGVSGAFTEGDGRFWAAAGATSGHDADDRVIYNTTTRQLFYDADGNGSGAAQLIATLQSGATLDATNIEVINGAGGGGGENITGTAGNDTLAGTAGDDTIDGLAGNDSISGLGGDDQLIGGSGIDTLDGGTGADTMQGGLQDDLYVVDDVGDDVIELEGGGSNDHVQSAITYMLPAWVNNLTLTGAADIDGTGNELDNVITGNAGANTLDGGDGADTLDGGQGNDTYLPGDGFDVLIDSGGTDTVIFQHGGSLPAGFENAIQRDIEPFVEWNLSGNELDNLMRHEGTGTLWMNGHEGDDTLIGGDGSDRFEYYNLESGNYGSDIVDGGVGNDWLFVGTYSAVVVDFRTGTVTGGDVSGASSIQFASIEAINGNSFGDHMTADDVGRLFIGDHGDDTLVGGAGDDRLWGGGGHDHPDTGIAGNDLLIGGAGDDFLAGGAENDTLDGGTGNDRLRGTGDDPSEDGADRFAFTVAPGATNADLIEDFVSGADTILLDGNAHGSIGASGDFAAGDVRFRAGASAQDADDRVIYNGATGELWYDADGNGSGAMQLIATLEGAPTFAATDITVENGSGGGNPGAEITGTSGDDTLIGTGGDDTIDGLGGNDSLRGEDGADSLRGGAGNDSLNSGLQDDAADTLDGGPGDDLYSVEEGDIILADPGGIDTVVAWNTHWVLGEGLDNLDLGDFSGVSSDGTGNELDNVIRSATEGGTLLGLGGNDTLIARHAENTVTARGGDGDDTLLGMGNDVLLSGDAGNDLLAGGGGFSSMTGGAGADTFFFDSVPGDVAADEQIADFASGVDAIRLDALVMPALGASGDFAASDARFAANSTGTAQDSSDRVVYNTSSGTLWYDADGSGSGAALLIATLQGAPGLAATDIEVINGGSGGNPGEEITGTGGNDTLTGTDGDDTINGLGGNDVILAGATGGTDVVDGGAGRDSIEFKGAATSAVVVDFVAGTITGGSDGSITFTGIERVVTGNFDDQLTGDGAAQNLTGQAGSDTLAGAGGVDTLWGGGGDDEFIFREMGSGNADRISDFASGSDGILLDDAAFTAIGGVGTFGAGDDRFAANASGTAQDGSDRVVYDTSSGQLYYDADGSGSGAAQLIATVQGAPGISATDISVI